MASAPRLPLNPGRGCPRPGRRPEMSFRPARGPIVDGSTGSRGTTMNTSGYAPVNGLSMYYEIHGTGRPLVLMHGGLTTIDLAFGRLLPGLAASRQAIGVELQGHGHTADTGRPLSLDSLADDIAGLLDLLDIKRADLFGFSLGGLVATQLAVTRPERVDRLGLAASPFPPGRLPRRCARSGPVRHLDTDAYRAGLRRHARGVCPGRAGPGPLPGLRREGIEDGGQLHRLVSGGAGLDQGGNADHGGRQRLRAGGARRSDAPADPGQPAGGAPGYHAHAADPAGRAGDAYHREVPGPGPLTNRGPAW